MKRIFFYIILSVSLAFVSGCSGQKAQNQHEQLIPGRVYSKEFLYSWFEDELAYLKKAEELNMPMYSHAMFFDSYYVNLDDVMNGKITMQGLSHYLRCGGRHYSVGNIMNCVRIGICGPNYYFQQIGLNKYVFLLYDSTFYD